MTNAFEKPKTSGGVAGEKKKVLLMCDCRLTVVFASNSTYGTFFCHLWTNIHKKFIKSFSNGYRRSNNPIRRL